MLSNIYKKEEKITIKPELANNKEIFQFGKHL